MDARIGADLISIVFCLRRLPTLSPEDFYRYWLDHHGQLVRSHAATLRIRRYKQGHTFADARVDPAAQARGCDVPPYDGVAEVSWDSVEDLVEASSTAQGRAAARELLEDERRFIDLRNSSLFYVREHEIVAD
jgi:EthD domain